MATVAKRETEPFSDINITPMIDVMLVLLVMLILTIPAMTHKVPIDLPQPGPKSATPEQPHRLEIARSGTLSWDGRAIADAELKPLLAGWRRAATRPRSTCAPTPRRATNVSTRCWRR